MTAPAVGRHTSSQVVDERLCIAAAFAPGAAAAEAWRTLTAAHGLDGVPGHLHVLLPAVAVRLADEPDVPFAGHLAGFRRRCWVTSNQVAAPAMEALSALADLTPIVVGEAAVSAAAPAGARPISSVSAWLPASGGSEAADRLAPRGWRRVWSRAGYRFERGSSRLLIADDAPPNLGAPLRSVDPRTWAARRVDLPTAGPLLATLEPTDLLLHEAVGTTLRSDRVAAAADVHVLVRRGGIDWDRLVYEARAVGAVGALREVLRGPFAVADPTLYEELRARLDGSSGPWPERLAQWLERPDRRMPPVPSAALGYLRLLPNGAVPGRGAWAYLARRFPEQSTADLLRRGARSVTRTDGTRPTPSTRHG